MNERRSFGPNSPTQAKTGLEWATRPYTNQSLKAFVVPALAKSARTGHPPVSVTLARSRATGSTPLGRPVFTTEAQSHREKMNERRSFGPNSPTQAKTGLEWATRLNEC